MTLGSRRASLRAAVLVSVMAISAYANSLGNGFAFDDETFIVGNEVVTEQRYADAFVRAAWPHAADGTGNYRPFVLSSFAVEWSLWGANPLGYHVLNVVAHGVVSLLVLFLLARWLPLHGAAIGAVVFAIHPVHTEAVANVMGRAELYAAMGYLGAVLLYLAAGPRSAGGRGARLAGLLGLYALALGSKEIATTLPAALVVLEAYRRSTDPLARRLRAEGLTYAALFGLLGCYLVVRWNAVGALGGASPSAGLLSLGPGERVLSALTVWPHYLRLLAFPLDLSADYSPAVLIPVTDLTADVVLGCGLLVAAVAVALVHRRRHPALALGFAWFLVTILPVSNLIVRADILLAERTLYLPSIGASLVLGSVAAGAWTVASTESRRSRALLAGLGAIVVALLFARTVVRNPTWLNSYTVMSTLARDHPESWMAQRAAAAGFERVGDTDRARDAWQNAVTLAPDQYQLLIEAARFHERLGGDPVRAEELLEQAIGVAPDRGEAYRYLAQLRLLRGDPRGAHAAAVRGLAGAGPDGDLWALLSEAYVSRGDLMAALRAREASLAAGGSGSGWQRLADLLDAMSRPTEARAARRRAGLSDAAG